MRLEKASHQPPKSYHHWKGKIIFIRDEVIPIAMEFRKSALILMEDMKIPKVAAWYEKLQLLPTQPLVKKFW
ncbi:hypothetical protein Hanom_Chr11g01012421 [Helianthus anomalus]